MATETKGETMNWNKACDLLGCNPNGNPADLNRFAMSFLANVDRKAPLRYKVAVEWLLRVTDGCEKE